MLNVFRTELQHPFHPELSSNGARELMVRVAFRMLSVLMPLFGVLLAIGVAASIVQVGFHINTEKLEPDFNRLNPATGWKRLFSLSALFRGFLMILKVIALAVVAYIVLEGRAGILTGLSRGRLGDATTLGWQLVMRLALYLAAGVAGVSAIDYFYQRRRFETSLRMTRQELKDEMKQEEGDPQIKARVRQIQRDRARQKMLREVPKATVVITNPTHYAVALRYVGGRDAAPVLVAKGVGPLAKRIAGLARNHSIPVLERPILARAIYSAVKEGQPIPGQLFRAVAEVLAFVYRTRGTAA